MSLAHCCHSTISLPATSMFRQTLFKRAALLFSEARAERPPACTVPSPCRRLYSIQAQEDSIARLPGIDASKLSITNSTTPKELVPPQELVFGRTFTGYHTADLQVVLTLIPTLTDHMLSIEWTASQGWLPPRITPYQNLSLDPATCVLHYAFECFEGMKAYKNNQGQIRLFRPDKNMARFNKSSARIALPTFEPQPLIDLISQFASMEARFIPE